MRNLSFLCLLILLAACGDGKLLQPEELASPEMGLGPEVLADRAEVKLVPFKGSGDWWVAELREGCEGDESNMVAVVKGDLFLTHLGRSSGEWHNCWTPAFEFVSHTATVTAANGDQLTWYGSVDDGTEISNFTPTTYILGPLRFTGGTGRFEGAVGEFMTFGTSAEDLMSGTIEFDGLISSTFPPGKGFSPTAMAQSAAANVKQDFHVQVFFTRTVEAGGVRVNSAGIVFGYDLINEFETVGDLNGFWYFQGKYKANPKNGKGLSITSPALWVINESEWGTGTFECNNSFRMKNWPTDDFLQYGNLTGCTGTGDFEGMKLRGFVSNESDPGLFVDSVYEIWGEIW